MSTTGNISLIHVSKPVQRIDILNHILLQENQKKLDKLVAERGKLQKALKSAEEGHNETLKQNQVRSQFFCSMFSCIGLPPLCIDFLFLFISL